MIQNDLGERANSIHRRWARLFLRSIRHISRQMKKSNAFSFHASTYHPTNKKLRSRRTSKLRRAHNDGDTHDAKQHHINARFIERIEYGNAVPRNWKDILRLDAMKSNHRWQDAVATSSDGLL